MYKLLIVDDEDMIRDGISIGIKWNELLFELDSCLFQYGISIRSILNNKNTGFQDLYNIDTLNQKAS